MSHIFRECEGFILKLARSFYFLGYNYTVPVDKRQEPDLYRKERMTAKCSPNGMGALSFEYDDVLRSPGLFPGVTMTVGALAQPVIARVAMLHIGTRHLLGRELSDRDVAPSELPVADLARDLTETVSALKELGCSNFGMSIQQSLGAQRNSESRLSRVSESILEMIDNRPAWRRDERGRLGQAARGAIETFGSGRPRD